MTFFVINFFVFGLLQREHAYLNSLQNLVYLKPLYERSRAYQPLITYDGHRQLSR